MTSRLLKIYNFTVSHLYNKKGSINFHVLGQEPVAVVDSKKVEMFYKYLLAFDFNDGKKRV